MLSDEKIVEIYKQSQYKLGDSLLVTVFDNEFYARSIEREANAPLIKQIKEDEELMARALTSLDDYEAGAEIGKFDIQTIKALRQRLEARK